MIHQEAAVNLKSVTLGFALCGCMKYSPRSRESAPIGDPSTRACVRRCGGRELSLAFCRVGSPRTDIRFPAVWIRCAPGEERLASTELEPTAAGRFVTRRSAVEHLGIDWHLGNTKEAASRKDRFGGVWRRCRSYRTPSRVDVETTPSGLMAKSDTRCSCSSSTDTREVTAASPATGAILRTATDDRRLTVTKGYTLFLRYLYGSMCEVTSRTFVAVR
jgi:hypothetical protein